MQPSTPEDEFSVHSAEETMREFSDECQELGDGVRAYIDYCQHCGRKVIAINQLPTMFMVNVCYPDGNIFGSIEVCPECVYSVLRRKNLEKSSTYGH